MCGGQNITVRLIDGKSGQPLSNLQVVIYGTHKARPLPIVSESDAYNLDVTGEEHFQFVEAKSSTHKIVEFIPCQTALVFADVKQIEAKGGTSLNRCSKKTYQVIPGELIVFLRKLTWWDRWKDFG
jgi:hypothetical protein